MIFGANMLRRDLHFDFFLVFIAGATITIFNILILIQKNYLLQGNLYLVYQRAPIIVFLTHVFNLEMLAVFGSACYWPFQIFAGFLDRPV